MKKLLVLLMGMLIVFPTFAKDFEYSYEGQTLKYTITDETAKECQVKAGKYLESGKWVSGNNVSGVLVIPSIVKYTGIEYSVTSIGDIAFANCSGLTSVTIPNSVTSIGLFAFINCSGLTSVTIPNSVTSIGKAAFSSCSALTSVTIPNSVTDIGADTFAYCSGLRSVSIPNSVNAIRESAFRDCSALTSVTIPNSVTYIGWYAFHRCSGLTSVSIPNSVTYIGVNAFSSCSALTSVTIPNSVNEIKGCAFAYCSGLTSVYYEADKPIKASSDNFSDDTYKTATLYMTEKGAALVPTIIAPWRYFTRIKVYDPAGVDDVIADFDESVPCEIYNLNGVKVGNDANALTPGLYIVSQDGKVKKISVK